MSEKPERRDKYIDTVKDAEPQNVEQPEPIDKQDPIRPVRVTSRQIESKDPANLAGANSGFKTIKTI